jgi:hypothetical protein
VENVRFPGRSRTGLVACPNADTREIADDMPNYVIKVSLIEQCLTAIEFTLP